MNDLENHAQLPVKTGVTYPLAKYTHPLKQLDIQIICDSTIKDDNMPLLMIFGS